VREKGDLRIAFFNTAEDEIHFDTSKMFKIGKIRGRIRWQRLKKEEFLFLGNFHLEPEVLNLKLAIG
jgi:hypothetical protein